VFDVLVNEQCVADSASPFAKEGRAQIAERFRFGLELHFADEENDQTQDC